MSRRTDDAARARAIALLGEPGASVRKVAAQTGLSTATVQRIGAEQRRPRLTGGAPAQCVAVRADLPFGPGTQPSGHIPPPAWASDQPTPPPRDLVFDPQYHGHTFRASAAPVAFEGWTVERIREAVAMHDQGIFVESSLLSLVVSRFGPVHAALKQAVAPALRLPRFIKGGQRGLARLMRSWIVSQIAPAQGLLPSAQFPPQLWGSAFREFINMGFCVLQHAYSEPYDLVIDRQVFEGVRDCYTRLWPSWALNYYRYRRTFVALTTEGPVDIISGDGKFTIIGDTDEPHFEGAIRAAGLEVLDGVLVKQARSSYIDRYGNPKWFAIMPPGIGARSREGRDFFNALQVAQGPDGRAALPHGSEVEKFELSASQSTVFKDALDNVWQYIAAIFLGSDGTLSKGTGVYTAPMFEGVAHSITDRNIKATVRGINQGHVKPQLAFNFGASIDSAAGWEDPVVDIPMPHPEADARAEGTAKRLAALHEMIAKERALGLLVDQDRINVLAEKLFVDPPTLAELSTPDLLQVPDADGVRAVRVREVRASKGLEPLGDDRDDLTMAELDAKAKASAQGGVPAPPGGNGGVVGGSPPDGAPGTSPAAAPSAAPNQEQAA